MRPGRRGLGRGRRRDVGFPGQWGGCPRRGGRLGRVGGAHARRAFLHLDEPAEDAEEPVLAVDRATYAVPPGRGLLVLVPTRRRWRRVAVHDSAASGAREVLRKPREEARLPGARRPSAAPATAPPAARSPAGLNTRPMHMPTGMGSPNVLVLPQRSTQDSRAVIFIIVICHPPWTTYSISPGALSLIAMARVWGQGPGR